MLDRKFTIQSFIFLLVLVSGCQSSKKPAEVSVSVSAVKIKKQNVPADFSFVAVAESSHIVQIRARVEGYLQSIDYKEGSYVKEGQMLFSIDPRPFIAALDQAKAELDRQKAILWNAEQIKNRMVSLYQQDAISERDLDNAISDELAAKANVAAQEANVYQADLNLSYATLQAPVSGMAGLAKYREGALISPGEQNLLTDLYVIDPIWINFSVSDRDLLIARSEIAKKQLVFPANNQFQVEAILSDGSKIPSMGSIDFTSPAIQQSTGTMLIRTVFANTDNLVYPGQFVRIKLKGAYRPDSIIVPQTAVVQGESSAFVYVIDKSGRAERRNVSLGDWFDSYWVILDGLKDGESVVALGVNRIHDQSLVHITEYLPAFPQKENIQVKTLGF